MKYMGICGTAKARFQINHILGNRINGNNTQLILILHSFI